MCGTTAENRGYGGPKLTLATGTWQVQRVQACCWPALQTAADSARLGGTAET